jgi:hypothetical protein
MKKCYIFFEVRAESLSNIWVNVGFKALPAMIPYKLQTLFIDELNEKTIICNNIKMILDLVSCYFQVNRWPYDWTDWEKPYQ